MRPVGEMKVDIEAWLRGLGLEKYAELLAANVVGPDVLPHLTDVDLRELGIPLGDRKRLLKAAATLRAAAVEAIPYRGFFRRGAARRSAAGHGPFRRSRGYTALSARA